MTVPTNRAIVTLTTDFGLSDHYVGTMKGVILSRCPEARIVDISHGVPAFSLYAGAYTIDQAARYYPSGTVHVVVVDPGVGTGRRAIAVEAAQQLFIAPDNGVLSLVCARTGAGQVWDLTNHSLFLPAASATFHGRDVFAPVAAALACGFPPRDLGVAIVDMQFLPGLRPRGDGKTWTGLILSVDHFGNVITNFPSDQFSAVSQTAFELTLNGRKITVFHRTFGDAPASTLFVYYGSSGFVEIGLRQASAAAAIGAAPGMTVSLVQ